MSPEGHRCIRCGGGEDLMDRAMAPGMTYCAPCRKARMPDPTTTATDPFRLRVAASIAGPPWWRPRTSRDPGVFLIGWLWVSLYIEWGHRG